MQNTPQRHSKTFVDFDGNVAEGLSVPVSQDGSFFHAGLRGGAGYRVGKKGEERVEPTFEAALAALRKMPAPYWRRPSRTSGKPGIVVGVRWEMKRLSEIYGEEFGR